MCEKHITAPEITVKISPARISGSFPVLSEIIPAGITVKNAPRKYAEKIIPWTAGIPAAKYGRTGTIAFESAITEKTPKKTQILVFITHQALTAASAPEKKFKFDLNLI